MSFASLTTGIRFNKKTNSKTQALFQQPATAPADLTGDLDDFFQAAEPSRKRRKLDDEPLDAETTDADAFRKLYRIKTTGTDVPAPVASFLDLESLQTLPEHVKSNLRALEFKTPTPIQSQAVPIMLQDRDLLACAPTGSGKTLAFLLPLLLQHLSASSELQRQTTSLILEPTRELASQVYSHAKSLATETSWKISLLGDKKDKLEGTANVIITTPLRLVYALKDGTISAEHVTNLVLDEGDKLFELDFLSQTDDILKACTSPALRKSLFSATFASGMEEFARNVMAADFIRIIVGQKDAAASLIEQQLVFCGTEEGKLSTMRSFLKSGALLPPVLVFVQSVERAIELNKQLEGEKVNVDAIHSERTQTARDRILQSFASGEIWVLICTDVLSRGIDFKQVNVVINYDFPQSASSYIHRIGRTGRNGRQGKAITYFTRDDGPHLKSIVNIMRNSGCDVPQWMLGLKTPSQLSKRKLKQRPTERLAISKSNYPMVKDKKGTKRKEKGAKGGKKTSKQVAQEVEMNSVLSS